MLNLYITETQQLLSNPNAPVTLYSAANITQFVNTARTQMAGETECVRSYGTLTVTTVTTIYPFSSITGLPTGADGIFNVRQAGYTSGTGTIYMGPRPFPWAQLYWLNNASQTPGAPSEWSQYKIGDSGSLYLNPILDTTYTLKLDVSVLPVELVDDNTVELIPYPYQDAVPYFAAYYAYMSAQRQQDAQTMYARYQEFVRRGEKIVVPNVLPKQYDQYTPPPEDTMRK